MKITVAKQRRPEEDRYVVKVRELVSGPLKAKWQETLRQASDRINTTSVIAATGHQPPPEQHNNGFESSLEDFFSVCDQIEANLRSALEIQGVTGSSHR